MLPKYQDGLFLYFERYGVQCGRLIVLSRHEMLVSLSVSGCCGRATLMSFISPTHFTVTQKENKHDLATRRQDQQISVIRNRKALYLCHLRVKQMNTSMIAVRFIFCLS